MLCLQPTSTLFPYTTLFRSELTGRSTIVRAHGIYDTIWQFPVGMLPLGAEPRSEEHTSEPQSPCNLVCRLLLEKKNLYISGAAKVKGKMVFIGEGVYRSEFD